MTAPYPLEPYVDRAGVLRHLTPGVIGYHWEIPSPEALERVAARRRARRPHGGAPSTVDPMEARRRG